MTRSHWVLLALVIGLGVIAYFLPYRSELAQTNQIATPDQVEVISVASSDAASEPEAISADPTLQTSAIADTVTLTDAPAAPMLTQPSFDVVRIEPDGSGLVAGMAEPGSRISIIVEGESVAEAEADATGAFVAFLDLPSSDAPRVLTLETGAGEARVQSEQQVIVGPTTMPEAAPVSQTPQAPDAPVIEADPVVSEAGNLAEASVETSLEDTNAEGPVDTSEVDTAPVATEDAAQTADTTQIVPQPSVLAGVPALAQPSEIEIPPSLPVLIVDDAGVRVLQPARTIAADAEVLRSVALDVISYDDAGEVVLSGRATGGGAVRIYVDNGAVAEAQVAQSGIWSSTLTDLATGTYVLRIDQVGADGAVISRIETPFRREERETIAEILAEEVSQEGFEVAVRTVQPGNTLWGISQERYGNGVLYVQVYEANRDLIRDPDLIYPGQVLRLPE